MRLVSDHLAHRRTNVAVIDERALHHPYLDRLFTDPDGFGLELQLEFMVDRALFVKRWLTAGHSLVMERSHLEDPVFIRHLLAFGHVTPAEHDAYLAIWAALDARLPRPDLMVLVDVPAAISIDRLSRDDGAEGRPPFADEDARRAWVTSWHERYRERFDELQSDPSVSRRIVTVSGEADHDRLMSEVAAALERVL